MKGQRHVVTWYFQGNMANYSLNTKVGQAWVAPFDCYPRNVRVHCESAPQGTGVFVNVLAEGVSLMANGTTALSGVSPKATRGKGNSFVAGARVVAEQAVTLQFTALGSKVYALGVTVQVEMEEA